VSLQGHFLSLWANESSLLQNVLRSYLHWKWYQLPRRSRHGVIGHLGRLLGMQRCPMQVPAQISLDLQQSIVRPRQL